MIQKLLRHKQKRKRLLIGAGVAAALGLFIGIWELPLPQHLRGTLSVSGEVAECKFGRLGGRHGSSMFFVGLRLDTPRAPYLRANPKHRERDFYESICARRSKVAVTYRAKDRLIGPVRFWVQSVHVLQ